MHTHLPTTRRLRSILALAAILVLIPASGLAQAQATFGGFLELTSVFFGEGTRTFGRSQVVTVTGSIPSIPWCPGMAKAKKGRGEGIFDFFPVADFYVMVDDGTQLTRYQELKDINGKPNRITGTIEGIFTEETVAITKPAGNTGPGRYRVVMDQCLDGLFDPEMDIVLGESPNLGFEVVGTGDLPAIDYHQVKEQAKADAEELGGTSINLGLGQRIPVPGICKLYGKLFDQANLNKASALFSWTRIALDRCADLVKEQEGIAADPPNPDYMPIAELGAITYDFQPANTPLERATRNLAHTFAEQAVIYHALLTTIERFQGAQAANDDLYTLLQMRAASRYIDLLTSSGGSLLRMYAALESFQLALSQDPLGQLPGAQELMTILPEARAAIGAQLGALGPATGIAIENGIHVVTLIGFQSYLAAYNGDFVLAGIDGIPQVRARNGLPPLVFHHPVAQTSGPYSAPPGRPVHFDASRSTDPDGGPLSYAWDFNLDGVFDDGAGATVDQSFEQPGTRLVGLKVTNAAGNANVSYVLVRIGDVNAQDVIGMSLSRELYRITPGGQVSQIKAGLGFNLGGLETLHVDVNKDIWVLNQTSIEHYDPNGSLVRTFTRQDVRAATGVQFLTLEDFAIDGRGDLVIIGQQDLGPGLLDLGFVALFRELGGLKKIVRMSQDGTRGRLIADVSQPYLGLATIDGTLHEFFDPSAGFDQGVSALAIDPQGFIVVGALDYPLDGVPNSGGIVRVHPETGEIQVVIPAEVPLSGYGALSRNQMVFGNNSFFFGPEPGPSRFVIDPAGQYVISTENNVGLSVRLYRILMPLEESDAVPPGLIVLFRSIQAFPVLNNTPNSPDMFLDSIAIDSGGDYIGTGSDFHGFLGAGLFRTSPIGELSKVADVPGPPRVIDVVPLERQVAPSDVPSIPSFKISHLTADQKSCPGAAQLLLTLTNTGSTALPPPVRVYFLDGDPEKGGAAIGSAATDAPLAAGESLVLGSPFGDPAPGVHNLFAIALGGNTISGSFQVCTPTTYASNPIVLSPESGTESLGSPYTVNASVRDLLGRGLSGLDLDFSVAGPNHRMGTATTDGSGAASFVYSGTETGQDSIVAGLFGISSNTVQATWQGGTDRPPVANAGLDRMVEATSANGAVVNLSGAASSDPDGDSLTFSWSGPFGSLTGVSISPTLPLGSSTVVLTVNDGKGLESSASVKIGVRDSTPPSVRAPGPITIAATEAGGARSGSSTPLAAFLASASASDAVDGALQQLSPLLSVSPIESATLFPVNTTSTVQFRFSDASGNLGTAASTVSVILGQPRLYIKAVGQGRLASGAFYLDLEFTNTGNGNAKNLSVSQFTFRTLAGSGNVSLFQGSPAPIVNLEANTSATMRVLLAVPSTVSRLGIAETGKVSDVAGTQFSFSASQTVIP